MLFLLPEDKVDHLAGEQDNQTELNSVFMQMFPCIAPNWYEVDNMTENHPYQGLKWNFFWECQTMT